MWGFFYSSKKLYLLNFQTNASYDYSDTNTENKNSSNSIEFRPDGTFFETKSNSNTNNGNTSNKANLEVEYKISPSIRLFIAPKFNSSISDSNSESNSSSKNLTNNTLTNDAFSKTMNKNESKNFSNAINFNKSFEKKLEI